MLKNSMARTVPDDADPKTSEGLFCDLHPACLQIEFLKKSKHLHRQSREEQQRSSDQHRRSRVNNCALVFAEAGRTENEPFNQRKSNLAYLFSFIKWIKSMAKRRTKANWRKECAQCRRFEIQAYTEAPDLHSPLGVWPEAVQSCGMNQTEAPVQASSLNTETAQSFPLMKESRNFRVRETGVPALPDSFLPSRHLSYDTMRKLEDVSHLPAWSNSTELPQSCEVPYPPASWWANSQCRALVAWPMKRVCLEESLLRLDW